MRRLTLLLVLNAGCPAAPVVSKPDAAITDSVRDAGPLVTDVRLDAWLRWQAELSAMAPGDGGVRARARRELLAMADAGLRVEEVDALEAVIAAVVAERSVARLSGAAALEQFKAGLAQLSAEQRARAEAALVQLQGARAAPTSMAALESQFGADAVRVVLSREAEVTKTWDALLDARAAEKR